MVFVISATKGALENKGLFGVIQNTIDRKPMEAQTLIQPTACSIAEAKIISALCLLNK